jgi:DNA-binding NarL/FixJ family response regulator
VVLSQYAEPAYAMGSFDGGTGGRAYLLKERIRDNEELIGAIEEVANGGSVIDPLVVDGLIQARARTIPGWRVSPGASASFWRKSRPIRATVRSPTRWS